MTSKKSFDVIVVGAGAAGVGIGMAVLYFIYKFRMCFPLIDAEIASWMQLHTSSLSNYDDANMVMRELAACCGGRYSCG